MGVLLIAAIPVGVILLAAGAASFGYGWRLRRQPQWLAVANVRKSRHVEDRRAAAELLQQALQSDPQCAPAIFDLAQDNFDAGKHSEAAGLFFRYLSLHPEHTYARQRLAQAYLGIPRPDDAIEVLLALRNDPRLSEESRASVTSSLAYAFASKKDFRQAIELASAEIGQKRNLNMGQQHCLHARAYAQYLSGQKSHGLHDLDRLFAINPSFPGVQAERAAMASGTLGQTVLRLPPRATDPACPNCGAPRLSDSGLTCKYCAQPYRVTQFRADNG